MLMQGRKTSERKTGQVYDHYKYAIDSNITMIVL